MRKRRRRFSRLGLLPIALLVALGVTGIGYSAWSDTATIDGTAQTGTWDVGGSTGFWTDWHQQYDEAQVVGWLKDINAGSQWLGPTTVKGLNDLFAATGGCTTAKTGFLGHYMATRLNIVSGRLDSANTHNITGIAGHNYLALSDPASATLSAIVVAIELKYPHDPEDPEAVWPTSQQYGIMKNVCDALNNLQT